MDGKIEHGVGFGRFADADGNPLLHPGGELVLTCPRTGDASLLGDTATLDPNTWSGECQHCRQWHKVFIEVDPDAADMIGTSTNDLRGRVIPSDRSDIVIRLSTRDAEAFEELRQSWAPVDFYVLADPDSVDVPLWGDEWEVLEIPEDLLSDLRAWNEQARNRLLDGPAWWQEGQTLVERLASLYPGIAFRYVEEQLP